MITSNLEEYVFFYADSDINILGYTSTQIQLFMMNKLKLKIKNRKT